VSISCRAPTALTILVVGLLFLTACAGDALTSDTPGASSSTTASPIAPSTETPESLVEPTATPLAAQSAPDAADDDPIAGLAERRVCLEVAVDISAARNVENAARCVVNWYDDTDDQCVQREWKRLDSEYTPRLRDPASHDVYIEPGRGEDGVVGTILDGLQQLEGVLRAEATVVSVEGQLLDATGRPIVDPFGVPLFLFDWESLFGTQMVQGRAPTGTGEFTVSPLAFAVGGLAIGGRYDLSFGTNVRTFELVGVVDLDSLDGLDATFVAIGLEDASDLVYDGRGYSGINVWTGEPTPSVLPTLKDFLGASDLSAQAIDMAELHAEDARLAAWSRSMTANLFAAVLCLTDDERSFFASQLLGIDINAATADCVLDTMALHPRFSVPPHPACT